MAEVTGVDIGIWANNQQYSINHQTGHGIAQPAWEIQTVLSKYREG
jgi:hypothetical protein